MFCMKTTLNKTRSPPDLNSSADYFGSSAISNFEGSTFKNKNFKILTFRGARAGQTGAPHQNISTDMTSGPKSECHIKF